MLQILHDKVKGIFASVILFLIIASFAFVGLNELFFTHSSHIAAKVDGHKIDWQTVMMFAERMERERGVRIGSQSLNDIRNALVQHQAVVLGLQKFGFRISNKQVAKAIASIPNFHDDNGQFSKAQYLSVMQRFGYQEEAFHQELAQTLLQAQVENGILFSNFWLPYEFTQTIQLLNERRDLGYTILPEKTFAAKIQETPEALQAYYRAHVAQYRRPEQVTVQYVELRLNQVADDIHPSEAELKNFYTENQGFYNRPELRHVRHIFFSTEGSDPAAQEKQAAKAEKVLAELKAGGEFATLAEKWSDDKETREKGGDLGWLASGEVDISFEGALAKLKTPYEFSPVVRTIDGYHIIQLLEHQLEMIKPFKDVKDLVTEQFRRQKAQQIFEEKKEQLAAIVFESPDSLDKAKQIMNLTLFETAPIDREGRGAEKWSDYPEFLQAAFSPAVVTEKRNSEVINLSPERAVVIRLKLHMPAEQLSYADVHETVRADFIRQETAQLLKKTAEDIKATIQSGITPKAAVKPYGLSWIEKEDVSRRDQSIDRWILEKGFMLGRAPLLQDPPKIPVETFMMPSGDTVVMTVAKVMLGDPRELDPKMTNTIKRNISDSWSRSEFGLWAQALIKNADIKLMPIPAELQHIPDE